MPKVRKRRVKRGKKKGTKTLKVYSYKRDGNATGEVGKINWGNLTAHSQALTWVNPYYEIANSGLPSAIAAWNYLNTHSLNQMAGLNDFIQFHDPPASGTERQLYGLYKITGIKIRLIPNLTALDGTSGVDRPTQITVQSVSDPADLLNSITTEARVNQFQSKKEKKLIWDGKSELSYYFKPQAHLSVVGEVTGVEGIPRAKTSPWLRMDQSGVETPHYGDKLFFKSTATFDTQLTNNFRIIKTFYVKFKQTM